MVEERDKQASTLRNRDFKVPGDGLRGRLKKVRVSWNV